MVRVLTAMSWCGRSSKLWHKNSNMDSRRPNSASNRVMPTDPSAEVASSDKVCGPLCARFPDSTDEQCTCTHATLRDFRVHPAIRREQAA
jgi:hypothetical protein